MTCVHAHAVCDSFGLMSDNQIDCLIFTHETETITDCMCMHAHMLSH